MSFTLSLKKTRVPEKSSNIVDGLPYPTWTDRNYKKRVNENPLEAQETEKFENYKR